MPAMMVSLDSGSTQHLNVGSSLVNRLSALDMLISAPESLGLIATEITVAGTNIDVIARVTVQLVNVSPELQSTPKIAQMSPAPALVISSLSSECIRTRRPTLTFLPLRVLTTKSSLLIWPWYTRT